MCVCIHGEGSEIDVLWNFRMIYVIELSGYVPFLPFTCNHLITQSG